MSPTDQHIPTGFQPVARHDPLAPQPSAGKLAGQTLARAKVTKVHRAALDAVIREDVLPGLLKRMRAADLPGERVSSPSAPHRTDIS